VTGSTQRGKKITQSLLVIHHSPRVVRGGRTTTCDLRGNTNSAQERGYEVVSRIWLPYMKVSTTLTYPNRTKQTFVDYADYRVHPIPVCCLSLRPMLAAAKVLSQVCHRLLCQHPRLDTLSGLWP
jgi:hypothetical protein